MAAIGRIYNQAFERSPAGTLAVTNGFLSGVADVVAQGAQIGVSGSHDAKNIKLTPCLSLLAYREAEKQPPPNPLMVTPALIQIPSYDPTRTLRFVAFGTFMGPILARWNHFLEHQFPLRPSAPAVAAAAQKLSSGTAQNLNKAVTAGPARGNVSITALAKRVGMDQLFMAPLGLTIFLGSMGIMERHSLPAIRKKFIDLYPPAIKANWTVWPLIQFVNFRFMPLPYRVPFQATCGVFWTLYLSLLNSSDVVEESRADLDSAGEKMKQAAATR